jgi:uracil-DNA glycosylase
LVHPAHARLVAERKACRACAPALTNPSIVAGGSLDSDRIGPYARWQGNQQAELMVVAQDFADVQTFQRVKGWPGQRVRANLRLVELVAAAGIRIEPPRIGRSDDRLFFTNAVLCLKQGGMSAPVPAECSRTCGRRFLRPTIELVSPRAVAALGVHAVKAVLAAFDIEAPRDSLLELIDAGQTFQLSDRTRLFPLAHPSNRTRSMTLQKRDWQQLGEWLHAA